MKKSVLALSIIPIISYLIIGCNISLQKPINVEPAKTLTKSNLPEPTIIETVSPTLAPTTIPTITPEILVTKENSDKDIHLKLPSGLTIDAYALIDHPRVEPLGFSPDSDYSQAEIMAIHEEDRKLLFPDNRIGNENIMIQFGDHKLKTRKIYATYPTPQPGSLGTIAIEVLLDDEVIYTAEGGKGNTTFDHLQGLWSYDNHWVLEYVYVTVKINKRGGTIDNVVSQVVRDGILLSEEYSYEEVFGFQLMKGKPFYFYKENGQIGVTYDGQEFMLGFEEIPRYNCCSPAELNPRQSQNMVSFFARKGGTWYYVEVGAYE
ncbi:MAG: hypothetical protein AB1846_17045 [Chloroflexota bacterium]